MKGNSDTPEKLSDNLSQSGVQQPLPLAFVNGEAIIEKPQDLFIPPDALEVILEAFEGPLDLLLYLIKKQKMDIVALPIAEITLQYMEYVEVMKDLKLELAGEYLLMAAMLAEIKSRLLLPVMPSEDDDEVDPRAELVKRLQEYERVKSAAETLSMAPQIDRDVFVAGAAAEQTQHISVKQPDVSLQDLVIAFIEALKRADAFEHHAISAEKLSTRERMSAILSLLQSQTADSPYVPFSALYKREEGKAGVVVAFLASLELLKEQLIVLVQTSPFEPVHIAKK